MSEHDTVFVELVESRYNALVRGAYLLCGDFETARDLVQTALTRVYAKRIGVRDPGAMEQYVRRTVVNLHISSWRRHKGRETFVAQPPEPAARGVGGERSPEGAAESLDVWRALRALAPRQRTAIVLRFFEDLPVAEAARLMDCSEASVKTHTARGLANLRTVLGEHALGDDARGAMNEELRTLTEVEAA